MSASTSSLIYWLRAWNIQIVTPNGTITITNSQYESLRVLFQIDMFIYPLRSFWQAEISIYNLSPSLINQILSSSPSLANPVLAAQPLNMGDTVSVSAGYQYNSSGNFNSTTQQLYKGRLFQSILTREDVVDYKLTLRCISALVEDIFNLSNVTIAKGQNDLQKINQIISSAKNPIAIENIDAGATAILQKTQQPGSQALFGRSLGLIEETAYQHNLYSWLSPNGLNIRSFGPTDFQTPPAYAYGPPNLPGGYAPSGTTTGTIKKTLIGVPEQTQDGVTFRVLMDSTPKIGDLVQLAPGTIIKPVALQYGGDQLPPIPSQTGVYIVGGLRYVGDSRGQGNDWYTEITGLSQDYFTNFLKSRTAGSTN